MPKIISSAELRNKYNEVSEQCHRYGEPTFVTKNGKGDLAIMSIEAYERMTARFELYSLLKDGLESIESGSAIQGDEFFAKLEERFRT